jgi:hypothetical protein
MIGPSCPPGFGRRPRGFARRDARGGFYRLGLVIQRQPKGSRLHPVIPGGAIAFVPDSRDFSLFDRWWLTLRHLRLPAALLVYVSLDHFLSQ